MMDNIKDFYLGTPMQPPNYAYMCIPVAIIPANIMDHYNLHALIPNGHVYVEIWHGIWFTTGQQNCK